MQQLLTPKVSRYCPHAPTEKQTLALVAHNFLPDDEPSEVFYGGSAGGGKSEWLLTGALEYVEIPSYAAIIFRRTYADLALPGAIMARSKEWLLPHRGDGVLWNEQRKQWTFPSTATLTFAYLRRYEDVFRYQSAEFQYVGFDELTHFTEAEYTYLLSRIRRPENGQLSQVPLRMRAASNPGGIGHGWVKKRFPIDGKPQGRRVFIPARLVDNPHLDQAAYKKTLGHLPPTTRAQLLDGDWDAFEGMAFPFDRDLHVVAPFEVPASWERFESFDHGTTNPSCLLTYVVDTDGNVFAVDEHYAPGLPSAQGQAIKAKRAHWWPEGTWAVTYADPEMWATKGETKLGAPASDITDYEELGVGGFVKANNDRSAGRTRVAEMLTVQPDRYFPKQHPRAGEQGAPSFYVVAKRCPNLTDQLAAAPLLPLDSGKPNAGEIVDPAWEGPHGHAVASCRYGLMSRPLPSKEQEQPLDDPRAEMARQLLAKRDQATTSRNRFVY